MWPVPLPPFGIGELYWDCLSSVRSKERHGRLLHLADDVLAATRRYTPAAAAAQLHDLRDLQDKPDDKEDRKTLLWAYTQGLVQNAAGRWYYDRLHALAPQGRCPFCGHRDVSTLDHQLPKASYPLLAISPENLVPACSECNHRKNDAVAATTETQTLHPYFESANTDRWLFARIVSIDPAALLFYAEPASTFTPTMQARIRHQFTQFRLAELYGLQASRQMTGEQLHLRRLRQQGGPATVGEHLREIAASWAATSVNCWQHAMYEALAADPDYLSNG